MRSPVLSLPSWDSKEAYFYRPSIIYILLLRPSFRLVALI